MKTNRLIPSYLSRRLRRSLLLLTSIIPASLSAQLHEQINVEGKYVPEIIKAERINLFPRPVEFSMRTNPLSYEGEGVAAGFAPKLMPLPATGWRADRTIDNHRGYLEAGTGSWLNSTLSAGYRFVDNASTLFGVRLQHNSTSLFKPKLSETMADKKQWRYDESIGLYASHVFKGAGRLDAAIDYHLGLFNYYGYFPIKPHPEIEYDFPTQTINDLSARFDWRSPLRPEPAFTYSLSAGVRHFAYRAFYYPVSVIWQNSIVAPFHKKGTRETDIELKAQLCMPWDNGSSIGLDAKLNSFIYRGDKELANYRIGYATAPDPGLLGEAEIYDIRRPNNYSLLTLTPYYRFTRGLMDIKLGADLDISFKAGEEGNRYPLLHVAPEVRFAVQASQVGVYLNVLGGSTLNTLASQHELDYYTMPTLASTRPTYTPLDASFGINIGPFSGFSMGVFGAYKVSRNIPLGGWYSRFLTYDIDPQPTFDYNFQRGGWMTYNSCYAEGINLHGYSVGAHMEYTPSKLLSIRLDGTYQPQKGEKGYFNGYDRARWTARAQATVTPISPLHLSLSYDYRGVRTIYTRLLNLFEDKIILNGERNTILEGYRLPDLCMLNFAASWDFTRNFSVWLQADNLLGRHDEYLPLQPAQGLVLTAGVKVLF